MGYEQPLMKVGVYPAEQDMSVVATNQFRAICIATTEALSVGTGVGSAAIFPFSAGKGAFFGILQNNPIQGEAAELTRAGISKVYCSGAWSVGDDLSVAGDGGLQKASDGDKVVAQAVTQSVPGSVGAAYIKA